MLMGKSQLPSHGATQPMRIKLIVGLVSIVASVALVEGAVRWLYRTPYQWEHRLMFYSEGRNFRNTDWGGFVYEPHAQIHARTYYITKPDPLEVRAEYEYQFTTNANGLVQLNEFDSAKPAIVFLGDSFTEGQGAAPWFYRLEQQWPEHSGYQLVNGGIVGTGVEAWGRLYTDLSTHVHAAKVVIIFISEDWTRVVWQFSQARRQCLKEGAMCAGPEDFYGLSEDPIKAEAQIQHIAQYRVDFLSQTARETNVFSGSSTYKNVVSPSFERLMRFRYTRSFETRESRQFEKSKQAVSRIVADVGRDNVLFIYIPEKKELVTGPQSFGRKANEFILQNGLSLVDGRAKCGLSIHDYYERDGHPNSNGYEKIRACVRSAIHDAFHT
jgi:hypothetical protein